MFIVPNFNEKLLRAICLNQAIEKFNKELSVLKGEQEVLVRKLQRHAHSEKLQMIIKGLQGNGPMESKQEVLDPEQVPYMQEGTTLGNPHVGGEGSQNGQELDKSKHIGS